VLPMAIPQHTTVRLTPHGSDEVVAESQGLGSFRYRLGAEKREGGWADYLQGITWAVRDAGMRIGGFAARIESSVPVGSGLSSSAALEVAMLRGLREAFELALDDLRLALLAQRVETHFVGAPVGVMDQMACSLADEHHALFIDTRSLETRRVALPDSVELVVISSGLKHSNVAGEYRVRRGECEQAAAALGVRLLREVTDASAIERLDEPMRRRARHVFTENERVLQTVQALESGDVRRVGRLFLESHASMRDDFQVSLPEIDWLVDRAVRDDAVLGARLTGGGFGGSIVALCRRGEGADAGQRILGDAQERLRNASLLVPMRRH
jgi:galactokinase